MMMAAVPRAMAHMSRYPNSAPAWVVNTIWPRSTNPPSAVMIPRVRPRSFFIGTSSPYQGPAGFFQRAASRSLVRFRRQAFGGYCATLRLKHRTAFSGFVEHARPPAHAMISGVLAWIDRFLGRDIQCGLARNVPSHDAGTRNRGTAMFPRPAILQKLYRSAGHLWSGSCG